MIGPRYGVPGIPRRNKVPILSAGAATAREAQNWVRFTRANTVYLNKDFAAATLADSDEFTYAGWIEMKNDGGNNILLRIGSSSTSTAFSCLRNASNALTFNVSDASFTLTLSMSVPLVVADWPVHFIATGIRTPGVGWTAAVYLNGVDASASIVVNTDATMALSVCERLRFGAGATPGTTNALDANVSDHFFSTEYTAVGNVGRFYDGGWVNLGVDGTDSGAAAPLFFIGGASRANSDLDLEAANGVGDGYNRGTLGALTPTGTVLNAPGKVRFDSTSATYVRASATLTGQPTAGMNSFLAVAKLRIIQDYRQVILAGYDTASLNSNFYLSIGDLNRLACVGRNSLGEVQFSRSAAADNPNGTVLPYNEPLLIAFSGRSASGGGAVLDAWHYNYATDTWEENTSIVGTLPVDDMEMIADRWTVGDEGSYKLNSEMTIVALDMATDGSSYLDLSNSTNRANLLLAAASWGVGTPIILFGEEADGTPVHASGWETNQGGGAGTWTLTGTLEDV